MQDHWLETAPPTYITSAGMAGYKPKTRPDDGDLITDPQQLMEAMRALPGGVVL